MRTERITRVKKNFRVQHSYEPTGFNVEAFSEKEAILEVFGDWEQTTYLGKDYKGRSVWFVTLSSPDAYNKKAELLVWELETV